MTGEEMCRELIQQAIDDNLVDQLGDPDDITAFDLLGMSTLLQSYLVEHSRDLNERWQIAVGHPLEVAEQLALDEAKQTK